MQRSKCSSLKTFGVATKFKVLFVATVTLLILFAFKLKSKSDEFASHYNSLVCHVLLAHLYGDALKIAVS